MAKVTMQKTELEQFIKLISLSNIVEDCKLRASKGLVRSRGMDKQRSVYFSVRAKAKVKEEGIIQVPQIDRFLEVLSRFSGTVTVGTDKQGLTLVGQGKRCVLRAQDETELDSTKSLAKISKMLDTKKKTFAEWKYGENFFVLTKETGESLVRDIACISTGEYLCKIILDPKKEHVLCVVEDRDTAHKFSVKVVAAELEVKKRVVVFFGYGLKEVLDAAQGDVKVYLHHEPSTPAWITSENGMYIVQSEKPDDEEE
jgi:hypothetical protein